MAEVFAGYDRSLDRRVAVKFLRADVGDPRARERFEHEARAAASFTHPNAVTVYDVGEDGRRPYIVMELIEGQDLAAVLAQRGPLASAEAIRIVDQMLAALAAAHAHGFVHRDVKPGNVLLAPDGVAKLADFGIAKAVSDATGSMTVPGQVLGTPMYLAPEQAAGETATPRSDLYSTGVVLYEMVTGAPPFTGDTPVAIALAHQHATVPLLSERRSDIPPAVNATVTRALEKDPARRFPDAGSMRAALTGAPAAATAVLPASAVASRGLGRVRRSWATIAVVALAAAAVVALGALALRDDGGGASTPPATFATTTTVSPTTTVFAPAPVPPVVDDDEGRGDGDGRGNGKGKKEE